MPTKTAQNTDTQADEQPSEMASPETDAAESVDKKKRKPKSRLTAADVADLTPGTVAAALDATVRVHEEIKDGETDVVERAVKARDIVSFRVDDTGVTAVTVDGRKHRVEFDQ